MAPIISTPRLHFSIWNVEKDAEAAIALWSNPQVAQYIDDGKPESEASILQSLTYAADHQKRYGCQLWAVTELASAQIIGCCGFSVYEAPDTFEMVFHFLPKYWGKGYATEAGLAALDYFESLHPTFKIVAGAHPDNKASWRVLEKLGFTYQGLQWFEDTQQHEPFFIKESTGGRNLLLP